MIRGHTLLRENDQIGQPLQRRFHAVPQGENISDKRRHPAIDRPFHAAHDGGQVRVGTCSQPQLLQRGFSILILCAYPGMKCSGMGLWFCLSDFFLGF
jgi:hypothetical protein